MIKQLSVLLLAGTLAACGGSNADDSGDGASAAEPVGRIAIGMKAPDPVLVELDPCELLTADDARPYLDSYRESSQQVSYGMKECKHTGGSFTSIRLEIGGMILDDFETKVESNHQLMGDGDKQEIPGIGDKAYFLRSLWVQSGDYILHIDVNSLAAKRDDTLTNKREQSIEIARKVLAVL